METKIASRCANSQSEPEPTRISSRQPVRPAAQAAPFAERTMRARKAGTPPASSLPPQNTEKKSAALVLVPVLLVAILICMGCLLVAAGVDFPALLAQFNALNGMDLLRFWVHLLEILSGAVLFPVVVLLVAVAAFREGKTLATQAVNTLTDAVRLCGVILSGSLKAVFNPDAATPDSPEDPIPQEDVLEEDPLFPDELLRDARKAGQPDDRTKIKK